MFPVFSDRQARSRRIEMAEIYQQAVVLGGLGILFRISGVVANQVLNLCQWSRLNHQYPTDQKKQIMQETVQVIYDEKVVSLP